MGKLKFPTTLYVTAGHEPEGVTYFADSATTSIDDGERVGVYKLVEIRKMKVERVLKPSIRKRG